MAEEEHEDYPKQAAAGAQQTIALPAARPVDSPAPNQNKLIRDREYSRRRREENRKRASTIDDDDEPIPTSSRRANKRARVTDDE
jgi:chromatin modification-related protein EAF6